MITASSSTRASRKRKSLSDDAREPSPFKAAAKARPTRNTDPEHRDAKRLKKSERPAARAPPTNVSKVHPKKKGRTRNIVLAGSAAKPSAPLVPGNAPTQVVTVLVFGSGESGELGLGPKEKEALSARLHPFLDPESPGTFHIVQLDCGGMHVVALTSDNKIITWGVNDNSALGRDTDSEGGLRDIDARYDASDSDLNPLESTPTPVPTDAFPAGTRFVQVAAGDSCSLALTKSGRLYGWGTFLVSIILF